MSAKLGDRSLFPALEAEVYLAHAAISPPSTAVQRAAQEALDHYAREGFGAWTAYGEQRERLKGKLAALIGARSEELALLTSTTSAVAAVATCFPWRRGDRVLCFEGEFPTNVTPWQAAATEHGLEVLFHSLTAFERGHELGLAALEEELARGVRLVAVSLAQFQTGLRMPVEEMGRRCRAAGAVLFVDAIQGLGVLPGEGLGDAVDFVAGGAHKWLMGLEGSGFLYASADAPRLLPRLAGWLSHEESVRFLFEGSGHLRYDRAMRPSPGFLESGSTNVVGFAALEAALDLILECGVTAVSEHVQTYLDRLEGGLESRGFRSRRTPFAAGRSGILGVEAPDGVELSEVHGGLLDAGVATTMPDGVLRFAPHWPNALDEVEVVLAKLDAVLEQGRGPA